MTLTLSNTSLRSGETDPQDLTFDEATYQKLPPLGEDDFKALMKDIEVNGVMVPVEVTSAGVVVDGHNRVNAAVALGMTKIPVTVRDFDSPDEAAAHVFAVNLQRRHLNRADKAKLIKAYLALDPYKSDRQVAAELGGAVTDKTVGAHRADMEEAGDLPEAPVRKTKAGGKQSAAKKSKIPASDRQKAEKERTVASTLRLGADEAFRLVSKTEGFTALTMLGVVKAPGQREKLASALATLLPLYLALAAELGVPGYEYAIEPEIETEVDPEDQPF